jgi:hypothetical protein
MVAPRQVAARLQSVQPLPHTEQFLERNMGPADSLQPTMVAISLPV